MKNIKNDYCIRMFVGFDKHRPAFSKVNYSDGCLFSTDAHAIAMVNSADCVLDYQPIDNYPNAFKIFEQHEPSEAKTFSVDELFLELIKIETILIPKMKDCPDCEYGETICSCCDSTIKCKTCDGNGEAETNEMEMSSESKCNLFNRLYNIKYLDRILKTAIITGVKEITISNGAKSTSGTLFIIGDFSIILMPLSE